MELKNLTFGYGVIRTDVTDAVIERLDPYFFRAGIEDEITSIKRTPQKQLLIIESFARKYHLIANEITLNMKDTTIFEGAEVPVWQVVWSRVRAKGVIVCPPVRAQVLVDVFIDGENIKGLYREPSEHFYGTCFDLGVRPGNEINREYNVVKTAWLDGIGIKKIVLERVNDCIHVACLSPAGGRYA